MQRKYALLIILGLFSFTMQAQDIDGIFAPDVKDIYPGANIETVELRSKELLLVSPITPKWVKADIITNNGNTNSDYFLKYDHYSKKIFLKKEDDVVSISAKHIKGFNLYFLGNERLFKKTSSRYFNSEFIEVLIEDKLSLYKFHEARLLKSNYNEILDNGNYNDEIVTKEIFFLKKGDNGFIKIPESKKQIKELLKKEYAQIMKFVAEENLKVNKENDLIAIVKYLNKIKNE